jgi:hypothetical protein
VSNDSEGPEEKGQSEFERVHRGNESLLREMLRFLAANKKWWLLPVLCVFLLLGVLVFLSTTAAAPFIYTLF